MYVYRAARSVRDEAKRNDLVRLLPRLAPWSTPYLPRVTHQFTVMPIIAVEVRPQPDVLGLLPQFPPRNVTLLSRWIVQWEALHISGPLQGMGFAAVRLLTI
jgi:hypothetical protein